VCVCVCVWRPLSPKNPLNAPLSKTLSWGVPADRTLCALLPPVTSGFPPASPWGLPPPGSARPEHPAAGAAPCPQAEKSGQPSTAPARSRRHFPATAAAYGGRSGRRRLRRVAPVSTAAQGRGGESSAGTGDPQEIPEASLREPPCPEFRLPNGPY
jgi:hypothetical protein